MIMISSASSRSISETMAYAVKKSYSAKS